MNGLTFSLIKKESEYNKEFNLLQSALEIINKKIIKIKNIYQNSFSIYIIIRDDSKVRKEEVLLKKMMPGKMKKIQNK